ncbi:Hint domain-containing protein [Antarctobacter heliothermus]|uniref:Hint domain-containing protein n=1 Tax=Antarctobacter heliothermus TaxID=74033 RepID=A0A239JPF8_9RHOB|nr:Hint domain-containing protein [Antarctobacter heliothermus]SNT07771.1 Hint domain-containing protein [Antarctobacter heliothermus]
MPTTFTAEDTEFATSSGNNVNYGPNWSYFDGAPSTTSNLSITSNDGDTDPGKFEVGETYDLTWDGNGGGAIDDAVITRSDNLEPGQGVIVFEGTNSVTGELVHIVWTPSVNLESWYYDNGGETSNNPGFWSADQESGDFQFVCFAKGTLIETPGGPRAVENLRPGDPVLTLDHGPQEILWTHSGDHPLENADPQSKPVLIRAGAFGPDRPTQDLIVSPQHRILVGGQGQVEALFAGECLAPAKALTCLPGIRVMSGKRSITWVHFACAQHQVVFANGCTTESLLLGPMALQMLSRGEQAQVIRLFGGKPSGSEALNGPTARACLKVDEVRWQINSYRDRKKRGMAQDIRTWDADLAMEESEAAMWGFAPLHRQHPVRLSS